MIELLKRERFLHIGKFYKNKTQLLPSYPRFRKLFIYLQKQKRFQGYKQSSVDVSSNVSSIVRFKKRKKTQIPVDKNERIICYR